MLKKEAQEKLLKLLGIPAAKIADLMADGEFDIEVPKVSIYDDAALEELKKNVRKDHGDWLDETRGKKLNADHKLGLSTADAKDPEKVLKALQDKAAKDAGATPDAALTEAQESIKALQLRITEKENEVATFQTKLKEREVNDKYRSLLHPDRNPALDDDEWIARLKKNYDIEEKDGKEVIIDRATGKAVKDNLENAISPKDVITKKFADTPEWQKPKAAEPAPAAAAGKQTHAANPALNTGKGKKYKSAEDVMKEVDKKYPKDSQKKGLNKLRSDYFSSLMSEVEA